LDDGSEILSHTSHEDGGVIDIQTNNLFLNNESKIDVNTYGKSRGAEIRINAEESVSIAGGEMKTGSFYKEDEAGDGGTISIKTKKISIMGNGSRLRGESHGSGKGGNISISASESAHISDKAWLSTSAEEKSTGDISIQSPSLLVETKAVIESGSRGAGEAGNIAIHAENLKVANGGKISVQTELTGSGGSLKISGPDPESHEDFVHSVILTSEESVIRADTIGSGHAGNISLTAKTLSITENASLATSSSHRGNAGDIILNLESLYLSKGGSVTSASKYIAANIYSVSNILELDDLADAAQEGEIAIVEDAGDDDSGTFIRTQIPDKPWVRIMEEEVTTVPDMTPLNNILFSLGVGPGEIFIVKDIGDGTRAAFVHHSALFWIRIKDIYEPSTLAQRDQFISLPGDIAQIYTSAGTAKGFIRIGEEWLGFKDIYTVPDLTERDGLAVQKGDVAKVEDAGNGIPGSFVYDGDAWTHFDITGNAGTITIHAEDAVKIGDDAFLSTENTGGLGSGTTHLDVGSLELSDSAFISATSNALGDAGTISVHADDAVVLKDDTALTTVTFAQGKGGDITLETGNLDIRDNARISSASWAESGGGKAGSVSIHAQNSVKVSDAGALTTQAVSAGGGIIAINVEETLHLSGGEITTSVNEGVGKGGDINIGNPRFVILNHGKISANAYEGDGGAIFIITDHYIKSSDSNVTATSKRGNDGTVRIDAPDSDLSSDLTVLPETFLDAARWMKTPCEARAGEKASRFVIKGQDAIPTSFDDWQPSPMKMPENGASEKGTSRVSDEESVAY